MQQEAGHAKAARQAVLALQQFALASERYTDAAAQRLGVHRTHLSALAHLRRLRSTGEPTTPGRLGEELNLSSPATTALIDRMQQAGHVAREKDEHDRRVVRVQGTDLADKLGQQAFAPLARSLAQVLGEYSTVQISDLVGMLNALSVATAAAAGNTIAERRIEKA